jgi:biuret amidohydrolase
LRAPAQESFKPADQSLKTSPDEQGAMKTRSKSREFFPEAVLLDKQLEIDYEEFKKSNTIHFPSWLYGPPMGKVVKLQVEDFPKFGQTANLELDSARTAFVSIDMQRDFCAPGGYVDLMGYDLRLTSAPIKPILSVLKVLRGRTDVKIIHTREGHDPDLSDAPYNKLLRSKLIGTGVGIGRIPAKGLGRLLIRGEANWNIVHELQPIPSEYIIDKPTKGAFASSSIDLILRNKGIIYLVLTGVTTDVCVHTFMREANDLGYWCVLLKDCTAATDHGNYLAAIKQIKMSGGIFGWVSDSARFIKAVSRAFE